jgi:hypothetical protein
MENNQTALVQLAQGQAANSNQLYNLVFPGLENAENYYNNIASGDPAAIMRAISPAVQQTQEATQGAKANIMRTAPAGGEKNLALATADVAQGQQVGKIASSAVSNAPNALASLAGQTIPESISAANTAVSGQTAASSSAGNLGNLQIEGQQIAAQQKGSLLGLGGSLAGDATSLGTASMGGKAAAGAGGKGLSDAEAAALAF